MEDDPSKPNMSNDARETREIRVDCVQEAFGRGLFRRRGGVLIGGKSGNGTPPFIVPVVALEK